jgi:hypothetical protein
MVLVNEGDGSFLPGTPSDVAGMPAALEAADLDGDGAIDLAIARDDALITVLPGAGDGSFGAAVDYATGAGPNRVAVRDLDDAPGDHAAVVEDLRHGAAGGSRLERDDTWKRPEGRSDSRDDLVDASLKSLIGSGLKHDALGLRSCHRVECLLGFAVRSPTSRVLGPRSSVPARAKTCGPRSALRKGLGSG